MNFSKTFIDRPIATALVMAGLLSAGAGAEFRRPLGFAIVGGLLLSQALTLFTTPVVYLYLDRSSAWLRGAYGKGAPRSAVPGETGPVISLHGRAE